MSVPTSKEFALLTSRVASLESANNALAAQLADDFTNNSGTLTDNYSDKGVSTTVQYTVTNLTTGLVAFTDALGTAYTLDKAGSAGEAATVTGLTAGISALETKGAVSVAAV